MWFVQASGLLISSYVRSPSTSLFSERARLRLFVPDCAAGRVVALFEYRIQCLTSNSVHYSRIRRRSIPPGMVLNCSQSSGSGTFLFLLLGLPPFSDYCWCTMTALLPRGYFLCYSPIIVPKELLRRMQEAWCQNGVVLVPIISYHIRDA